MPTPSVTAPRLPARLMSAAEWGMLIALSILWGGSFLFIGIALREVPVLSVVAFRVVVAALALHLVLRVRGIAFPASPAALSGFVVMGVFNNVIPFSLLVFGQSRIESGLASILNATTPIFTILIAHVVTQDEKLGARKAIGVLLGFLGVVVLFSGRDLLDQSALMAQIACVGAAMSYGISGVFGRRFARLALAPVAVATGQLSVSALVMLPLALFLDAPFSHPLPGMGVMAALLTLALVSTAGAYILFFRLLGSAGATNISLVTLLVPCSAVLFGAIFLGERLELREIEGFVVIAAGLLVIDGRLVAAARKRLERSKLT